MVVELRGDRFHARQQAARNPGEVMMLVVVTNIVRKQIEGAIVAVGFLAWNEFAMLGNKMTGHRMQAHAEEAPK